MSKGGRVLNTCSGVNSHTKWLRVSPERCSSRSHAHCSPLLSASVCLNRSFRGVDFSVACRAFVCVFARHVLSLHERAQRILQRRAVADAQADRCEFLCALARVAAARRVTNELIDGLTVDGALEQRAARTALGALHDLVQQTRDERRRVLLHTD